MAEGNTAHFHSTGCPRKVIYAPKIVAQNLEACVKCQAENLDVDRTLSVGSTDAFGTVLVGSQSTPEASLWTGMTAFGGGQGC